MLIVNHILSLGEDIIGWNLIKLDVATSVQLAIVLRAIVVHDIALVVFWVITAGVCYCLLIILLLHVIQVKQLITINIINVL